MGSYSYAAGQTGDRKDARTSEKSIGKRTLLFYLPIDRKNRAVQRLIFQFKKMIVEKSTPNSCSPQDVTSEKLIFSEVDFHRCPTGKYYLSGTDPGFEIRTLDYPSVNPCLKRERKHRTKERVDI